MSRELLCAGGGLLGPCNTGWCERRLIQKNGCIPDLVDRRKQADILRHEPGKKARRWAVEVCQSGFKRFGKRLVRDEKLDRRFVALNHLAAAIIALRKLPSKVSAFFG